MGTTTPPNRLRHRNTHRHVIETSKLFFDLSTLRCQRSRWATFSSTEACLHLYCFVWTASNARHTLPQYWTLIYSFKTAARHLSQNDRLRFKTFGRWWPLESPRPEEPLALLVGILQTTFSHSYSQTKILKLPKPRKQNWKRYFWSYSIFFVKFESWREWLLEKISYWSRVPR